MSGKIDKNAQRQRREYDNEFMRQAVQKVRHFGFMHKRSKFERDWLSMLVTVTLNMVYVLIVTPHVMPVKRTAECSACGGDLVCVGYVSWSASSLPAPDSSQWYSGRYWRGIKP